MARGGRSGPLGRAGRMTSCETGPAASSRIGSARLSGWVVGSSGTGAVMGRVPARRLAPRGHASAVSEQVFAPRSLARVLGVQYAVGGALALGWALLPTQAPFPGRPVVQALASLAIALGALMGALSVAP